MNSEGMERGLNGVSHISFLPWKGELLQGTTLRNRYGDPSKPFDLACEPDTRRGQLSRSWELFRDSVAGHLSIVVRMEQVRGGNVETVNRDNIEEGDVEGRELLIDGCDGLITNVPNLMLTARVADCIPIFLYDRPKGAIGLLHAGWKGTAAEILTAAVERMKVEYRSEPADLEVYMGPSIERACYPVNGDIYSQFERWNENHPNPDEDWKVDLQDVNRQQAMEEGIPEEKITISRYCTACSRELLYSHRVSMGNCGRMVAFSALRK